MVNALQHPVKLDLKLIEADQITTPNSATKRRDKGGRDKNAVDGIEFDSYGNPAAYHMLTSHPGAGGAGVGGADQNFDRIPAASMIHWFRSDRPGQSRGLPDLLPALPLFADLRSYTLSVIQAAKSAAQIAIFMKTNAPTGGEAADVPPDTTMEFEPNMAVFGPEGWEPMQIKAEQPTTSYAEFKKEILNEIARCLNMPFNIAACNSSGYNYSSGRLDHQTYYKNIRVEQDHCEDVVLDRILYMWLAEAVKVYPELIEFGEMLFADGWFDIAHQWFWDGREHVDPAKEATAQATRLANNTTTLATEYAKFGKDWETEIRQRAREVALCRQLGLTPAEAGPSPPQTPPSPAAPNTQKQEEEEGNDESEQSEQSKSQAA